MGGDPCGGTSPVRLALIKPLAPADVVPVERCSPGSEGANINRSVYNVGPPNDS